MSFTPIIGGITSFGDSFTRRSACAYSPDADAFASISGNANSVASGVRVHSVNAGTLAITTTSETLIPGITDFIHSVSCDYDTVNKKFLFIYANQNVSTGKLYGTVGTLSGTTMSLGVKSVCYNGIIGTSYSTESITDVCYDKETGKFVVFYNVTGTLYYSVGTISGATVSFGTAASLGKTSVTYVDSCFNDVAGKIVVSYASGTNLYAALVNISGTTISLSNITTLSTSFSDTISIANDFVSGKSIVLCRHDGPATGLYLIDTDMTLLSSQQKTTTGFALAASKCASAVYDENCKKIMVVSDLSPQSWGYSITISGSSFSTQTPNILRSSGVSHGTIPGCAYSSGAEKIIFISGVTTKYQLVTQLDESAPRPFWTNFYSQSETVV